MNPDKDMPYRDTGSDRRLCVFLAAFYTAWVLRVVVLLPVDASIGSVALRQCWSQGLRLLLWVVPVFVFALRAEGAHPAAYLGLTRFPRGRALARGLGILTGFLTLCGISAVLFQGGGTRHLFTMTGADWAGLLLGMSLVAFAEELLFRGLVFQQLRRTRSFQRANLLTALLFLLIHWPGWLYMQGPHWGLVPLSASILVAGWVFGWMMETTQSLWPPIVLHLLNNVLSAVLLG